MYDFVPFLTVLYPPCESGSMRTRPSKRDRSHTLKFTTYINSTSQDHTGLQASHSQGRRATRVCVARRADPYNMDHASQTAKQLLSPMSGLYAGARFNRQASTPRSRTRRTRATATARSGHGTSSTRSLAPGPSCRKPASRPAPAPRSRTLEAACMSSDFGPRFCG